MDRGRFLLLEQFGVRASAHEDNPTGFTAIIELVRQQKITADVAPMPLPFVAQRVVELFSPERAVVGDQQEHGFLEPVHVVPPGS